MNRYLFILCAIAISTLHIGYTEAKELASDTANNFETSLKSVFLKQSQDADIIDIDGLKNNQLHLKLMDQKATITIKNKRKNTIGIELNVYSSEGKELLDALNIYPQSFVLTAGGQEEIEINISDFSKLKEKEKLKINFRISNYGDSSADFGKETLKQIDAIVTTH